MPLLPGTGCPKVFRNRKHQVGIRLRLGAKRDRITGSVKIENRSHQKMWRAEQLSQSCGCRMNPETGETAKIMGNKNLRSRCWSEIILLEENFVLTQGCFWEVECFLDLVWSLFGYFGIWCTIDSVGDGGQLCCFIYMLSNQHNEDHCSRWPAREMGFCNYKELRVITYAIVINILNTRMK